MIKTTGFTNILLFLLCFNTSKKQQSDVLFKVFFQISKNSILLIVVILLFSKIALAKRIIYNNSQLIKLDLIGTDTSSKAWDINNKGQVIGYSETIDGKGVRHAFIWDNTNGMQYLGTLGGINNSAYGINNLGQVVGCSEISKENHIRHAFIYSQGNMVGLGTLGGDNSVALSINDQGQVVGYAENEDGTRRAFLWDINNGMIELNTPIDSWSVANDINNKGQIVGAIDGMAVCWGRDNSMQYLSNYYSSSQGINEAGQIAGYFKPETSFYDQAFIWDSVHGLINISQTEILSEAFDINNEGDIVGAIKIDKESNIADQPDIFHAFIWDENHGLRDLNNILILPEGNYLRIALSINDIDQIAGWFYIDGIAQSFVLTPAYIIPDIIEAIYVDKHAEGDNNGHNWANAFNLLQDAIAVAEPHDKIFVADGTYYPDQGKYISNGDRAVSFQLKHEVSLMGGFAGYGANDPNERDPSKYLTILSGDLNGNDADMADIYKLRTESSRSENSYHVVTFFEARESTILDGFVITAGQANGIDAPKYHGGGIYMYNSSPTISNCIFTRNSATYGGGMAIYTNSKPRIRNCRFYKNAAYAGGAVLTSNCRPEFNKCSFYHNHTKHGAGIYNTNKGNSVLTNCLLYGNCTTTGDGGGIYNNNSNPIMTNCTISLNKAKIGGGIYSTENSSPTLANMILWGNKDNSSEGKLAQITGGRPNIFYSTIAGWFGTDPQFAAPDKGDFHLKSQAGRWNNEAHAWIIDSINSPAIDEGSSFADVGNEPEPNGKHLNQGVYGGTTEASKSPWDFGHATCTSFPPADADKDCKVDLRDFAILASEWLSCNLEPTQGCWQ